MAPVESQRQEPRAVPPDLCVSPRVSLCCWGVGQAVGKGWVPGRYRVSLWGQGKGHSQHMQLQAGWLVTPPLPLAMLAVAQGSSPLTGSSQSGSSSTTACTRCPAQGQRCTCPCAPSSSTGATPQQPVAPACPLWSVACPGPSLPLAMPTRRNSASSSSSRAR